ncbi:class I SAM-dependent methyltransferase [Paenibacillus methanolicus]|uniref:Methyltransferase family protein n=1 Tax=Paenibacillus methanolicus TaxID=582686 RepID=A0A5S5CAT2_9BACL|nr:class I SAM-dependent methyltransferase [Paenibacillus methanolicus]TYP75728.1 methyltransferase family protein [Paenibacillus methanolicus]
MNCCICGHLCRLEEKYDRTPHMLMSAFDADRLKLRDIEIYQCEQCGHGQMPAQISEEYYDDYAMGSFWGASFRRVREQQIERLGKWAPARKRFLDIGCGVGHYLALAKNHFEDLQGVEPSATSVAAARERGFSVIHDYFHGELPFADGFDVITIIEVLEHLEDPAALVEQAARLLNDNGVMLVEVPNGQRIMQNRLYYNLCTDHIQYFSPYSLSVMANRVGLTVICAQESDNPNLLELYVRQVPKPRLTFKAKRDSAFDHLIAHLPASAKVAAWGAGAEAMCFLAMLEGKVPVVCLFDTDPGKHGHTLAGIPIMKPTPEEVNQFEAIIIFANAHEAQIRSQLDELGYVGTALSFEA